MAVKKYPLLETVSWKDVRNDVIKVNPDLANIIDAFDPGEEFPLIKARYKFGQKILHHGELYLPKEGVGLVRANDSCISREIQKMLAYRVTLPAGIALNKIGELYVDIANHINPWRVILPGKIFGLWNILQERGTTSHVGKMFQLTAGARSIFMAPKISDAIGYKNLNREFNIKVPRPKRFLDQWHTFVELNNHTLTDQCTDEWQMELLFFSEQWLIKNNHPLIARFRAFLYELVWLDSSYLRDQITFNSIFSYALRNKNLKPNPYLADTVKHLYLIGRGSYPSFVVAQYDSAGPIASLQKIFIEVYNLKYAPTILHPWIYPSAISAKPCYYFLSFPTLIEFLPRTKELTSKFEDLREIKYIMKGLLNYILEDNWGIKDTPIYHWAENVNYEYFHTDKDKYGENIRHTREILEKDISLIEENKRYKNKPFCDSSSFFRGCIQISTKNIM